jgi:hypothetical protein
MAIPGGLLGPGGQVFKRAGCKTILICVPVTGEVSHKELGDVPERENFVIALWRRLFGEPIKK